MSPSERSPIIPPSCKPVANAFDMPQQTGCWTCKVRRKRCTSTDGGRADCGDCQTLCIPCHRGAKPVWMDGGRKQEEMAAWLKREVRMHSHHRPNRQEGRTTRGTTEDARVVGAESCTTSLSPSVECTVDLISDEDLTKSIAPASQTVLLSYYHNTVHPFLLPFYHPDILQEGGSAWLLELTSSSPVFRRLALFQASYFLAITRGTTDSGWEAILAQTKDVFGTLRNAVSTITHSSVQAHLRGAVRIFACIMQMQRFEVALMSFENCRAHLEAATSLFHEILSSIGRQTESGCRRSCFLDVTANLGPPVAILEAHVYNPEQAALRLSSALLLFDDVIASTALRESPRLLDFHEALLESCHGHLPLLDLERVVGCPNWVLLAMGKTAALAAWKLRCQRCGSLDALELASIVITIRDFLQAHLSRLEAASPHREDDASISNVYQVATPASRTTVLIWAHAAFVYLLTVASGLQASNHEIRFHVNETVMMLHELASASPLHAMAWPLYTVGSVADESQRTLLRRTVAGLQPRRIYGALNKALEVLELTWKDKTRVDQRYDDHGAILADSEGLVLLI